MIDTSEFTGILSIAVSSLGTGAETPWNCFAVGYREPSRGGVQMLEPVSQPPYSDYTEIVTLIDGCPDGALLFWCCAVGRSERASLAIEVHVHNDLPRELVGGRFWRDASGPQDVCRFPCVFIAPDLIRKAREMEFDQPKRGWLDRLLRRA